MKRLFLLSSTSGIALQIAVVFEDIESRFGHIDALVNAAGAMRYRLLADCSDEDIDAVFGANLMGPLNTIRAAIPLLKRAGGGDIVNIGSEVTEHDPPLRRTCRARQA